MLPNSKLKIAFAPDAEQQGIQLLTNALRDKSQFIELVSPVDHPQFLFKVFGQSFRLTLPHDERPVFPPVEVRDYNTAIDFATKTESVAKWHLVNWLSNPSSGIAESEFRIELFRIDQPGNFDYSAAASEMDWRSPVQLGFDFLNGKWQQPAFRLKISNTGNRTLWVHALYLSHDFGISDRFLPKQELKPGETVWLKDMTSGHPTQTIPLNISNTESQQVREFIKLFISTQELPLQRFNQEELLPGKPTAPKRGISAGIGITAPEWTTRDIELVVTQRLEEPSGAEPPESSPVSAPPQAPPPPPQPSPKKSPDTIGDKLKDWFGLSKSKNEKQEADTFPSRSKKIEIEETVFEDDWVKIYPELNEEIEESPPPSPKRSISTKKDELPEGNEGAEHSGSELPGALKSSNAGDQVDCSVFAPPEIQKGEDIFIQVWLHLPQLGDQAKAMAVEFDESATQRAFQSLKVPLEKGDELSFVLETEGIEINNKVQHITWNGSIQSVQFAASVPPDFAKSKAIFTLRVFMGEMPVGHIMFIIKTTSEPVAAVAQPLGTEAKRYKKAFISYSSKDRDEVLKRVQMLDKVGIEYFQDVLNLNPGERWERKLYENINDSDVFFLFWSTAAKDSKWVLQELEYAIKRKQGIDDNPPLIQPVPIEGPPIVSPPEILGHMHFNDRILYFIMEK